jgi:hypothetical protein
MRFVPVTSVLAWALAAATGVAIAAASPAAAAAATAELAGAAAGPDCSTLLALTGTQLCVTAQSGSASIRPGGTASYDVTVAVVNGFALGVTVTLSSRSGGTPSITSGCPTSSGSATCSVPSLNFLGSPASYQLSVQVPSAAGASSVTLTATASVALLGSPPSATASVPVVAPPPPPPPSSPAPTGSHPPAPHPSGGTGHPPGGTGHTHGSGGHSPGGGSSGAGGSPGGSGSSGAGSSGAGGLPGGPGSQPAGGSRGAGQDVGAPGPIPLPLDTAPGPLATVGAGSAAGLFPQIGSGSRPLMTQRAMATGKALGGMPLTSAAVVFGILAVLAWAVVALLPRYRRRARR